MCGILFYISKNEITPEKYEEVNESTPLIRYRGPDEYIKPVYITKNILFAFHRLSINDTSANASQPMKISDCIFMCNGEIYNHVELSEKYNLKCQSKSDCECIPLLYRLFGFKRMLQLLEGVFAIVLYDSRSNTCYVGRDPIGVRPLFISANQDEIFFASEAKCLGGTIAQFPPGHYATISYDLNYISMRYIDLFNDINIDDGYTTITNKVRSLLDHAVKVRCSVSMRPVGAFLSGGIDSSIVAMIAKKYIPDLRTFSIGLEDSKDLKYAQIASKAIGSKHTEVRYSIEEGLSVIPEICRLLETSDITTIRASVPMYLLSKWIKQNTDITVILSGEGADEVFAGYLYNHSAPSSYDIGIDAEIRVSQLPWYDVLRADRTTAGNSLEIRVPFLCKNLVRYAFSISPDFHNPSITGIEKKILRDAFRDLSSTKDWEVIIDRPKEAFSDGVGYSWKQSITNLAEQLISDEELAECSFCCPTPKTKEALLYRKYYETWYSDTFLVTNYWMPSWVPGVVDPSATVLDIHKKVITE